MRQRRVGATSGTVDRALAPSRRVLLRAGLAVLAAWAVVAFAQEAWTANRLNADAAALHGRNAVLQSQNDDYRRDILAVVSGGAAEEVARQNGYSRPDEHLYLVSAPPPQPVAPAPTPKPATVHDQSSSPADAVRAWWNGLTKHGRTS
jgi:cell division protein FtsB